MAYRSNCHFVRFVGELVTASIRPTIMYGEEDHLFFPTLAKVTKKFGGIIPKVLGAGGKHQQTYVGMCARHLIWLSPFCQLIFLSFLLFCCCAKPQLIDFIVWHVFSRVYRKCGLGSCACQTIVESGPKQNRWTADIHHRRYANRGHVTILPTLVPPNRGIQFAADFIVHSIAVGLSVRISIGVDCFGAASIVRLQNIVSTASTGRLCRIVAYV